MIARTRDGADIFYQVYDFTDPWRPAETVFLHGGLRSNHRAWYRWVPLLAGDYRLVAVDPRGRGSSTIPPAGFAWSVEQFASDDLAVLDALGVERAHVVGASFGAAVAEYLAAKHADRLQTLTLVSPPYRFTQAAELIDRWLSDMDALGPEEFLRRDVKNLFPPESDPGMLAWQAEQMAAVPPHVARDLLRFLTTVNLADLLPDIAVPTLILAAARSDRAPSGEAEHIHRQIRGSRLVTFDSHHNIAMTMPERCVEAVRGFLREHPIPR